MKAFAVRAHTLITLIFAVGAFLFYAGGSFAQVPPQRPAPTPHPTPVDGAIKSPDSDSPLTTFEEEMRAKRAIKLAEKDHQENLNRAHEIAEIGKGLQES